MTATTRLNSRGADQEREGFGGRVGGGGGGGRERQITCVSSSHDDHAYDKVRGTGAKRVVMS